MLRNPRTSVANRSSISSPTSVHRALAAHSDGAAANCDVEGARPTKVDPDNIMLGFQSVSLSSVDPPKHIIANVSGYVVQGGITAVLGPSSSGKSVLLKVLTGRLPTVECTGEVTFCGAPIDPHSSDNGFGFVSQEDTLIGDLTVRETFEVAACLRNEGSKQKAANDAEEVIQGLGLGKVGDNVIGTILKRGLSGGEKRRTSVGQELVVKQALAFLDEPTSGLDGTAAYDVVKTIQGFTRRSSGDFSVMMSIHQPNGRILELFDHILLLGRGGSLFFGTLPEAIRHFTRIGYPPPSNQVPTDFFMQVTCDSSSFTTLGQPNFTQVYATSSVCARTVQTLELSKALLLERTAIGLENHTFPRPGFIRQLRTLLWRDSVVAARDPTLYYLQLVLHLIYGLFVGLTFWDSPRILDDRNGQLAAACVWCIMLQAYIHVFKVFYLVNSNRRFDSERANLPHGVLAFFIAETFVTAVAQLLWVPGTTVAYFMIGLPPEAYFFSMFVLYTASLTAESMLNVVTKLTNNTSLAIVISQACLVILTVFAGGLFRPFDEIPPYWSWAAALSLFTYSSKAYLVAVYEHLSFTCPTSAVIEFFDQSSSMVRGLCVTVQHDYVCDAAYDSGTSHCEVKGTTVIDIDAGGLVGSKWRFLLFNLLLMTGFRVAIFFFLRWPKDSIVHKIKKKLASPIIHDSLSQQTEIQMLWGEVVKLKALVMSDRDRASLSSAAPIFPVHSPDTTPATTIEQAAAAAVAAVTAGAGAASAPGDEGGEEAKGPSRATGAQGRDLEMSTRQASRSHYRALEFKEVHLELPESGKVLIDKVTGRATTGRVLALMGPSGAGKTTLLNALSGRATYAQVTGSVTLGGRALDSDDLDYVPQFDDLNETFSARELLTYMRLLKVREKPEAIRKSVLELLQTIGLLFEADKPVSALSGGEKKRLSIALGVISEPNVLFLDEPTTGLDSAAAHSVVKYISRLAAQTKVVCIMTIHQPAGELFDMLEDLMLLEGGRLAYFGTSRRARVFFDSLAGACPMEVNPADHYLDLISKPPAPCIAQDGDTWRDLYLQSEFNVVGASAQSQAIGHSDELERNRPDWRTRCRILTTTLLTYYWRTKEIYWLRLVELAVLAVFVGTMFFRLDNSQISESAGAAFFNIWCVLFSVVASVPAFARDRKTTLHEMLNGAYGPQMHCAAQFLASVPYTLVCAVVYQSIFHWLVGFNDSFGAYIFAILLSASLLFMMEGVMLLVVESLKNAMLACTFSMVILGILFLFAGFFIKPDDMPILVRWLTYIIPTRFAFDGYLHNIFHGQDYVTTLGDITGDQILQTEFAQSSTVNKWIDFLIMTSWVLWLRIAHFGMINHGLTPYRNAMAVPVEKAASSAA